MRGFYTSTRRSQLDRLEGLRVVRNGTDQYGYVLRAYDTYRDGIVTGLMIVTGPNEEIVHSDLEHWTIVRGR